MRLMPSLAVVSSNLVSAFGLIVFVAPKSWVAPKSALALVAPRSCSASAIVLVGEPSGATDAVLG